MRSNRKIFLFLVGLLFLITSGCDLTPSEIEFIETQLVPLISPIVEVSTPTLLPTETEDASFCVPLGTARMDGEVVDIIDGDTIDVRLEDGQEYRVRYIGIDTPERGELFYSEASNFNEEMVAGKVVTLVRDVSETDQFGRLLAYVVADNVFVNYEIIRSGYAAAVTFPPDVACAETFAGAERLAREEGAGLWGLP